MTEHTDPTSDESPTNGKGAHDAPETMFDSMKVAAGDLAERAGPTVRELSARAAELTATAAVRAGPFARRAGEAAADASQKLAESARGWAADLRRESAGGATVETSAAPESSATYEPAGSSVAPSDLAAEQPPVASPLEETAPSPAYEEGSTAADYGAGGTDEGATRPGI